ncbi:flippase [Methanofollis aquaemaris]|uniref:Flippase n=1 Tax=Methanofollis aquaemaris TaxID=126734 RepID=A0A8A3S7F1_9EURY|nr:oligosaccharide flippase family protein [Methanofollis aquaemaris]QSZ67863.1 flippase [Methanofollis aquaemaris]
MHGYQQFARRIGLIGITNLLIGLSGLILLPILTKTLPIEEYGTYVQITVTIGLVPGVVMLGLSYTMVRFLAATKSREEIQEGYYSIVGITILTAGLASATLFILAEPLGTALFDGRTAVTRILALAVFLECMNLLQFNYFRTFQQIKKYSSLLFFKTCLQLIMVGGLVLAGYGIFGAVMGLLITDLTLFLIMGALIISEIGFAVPKFIHIREYLSFGFPTVPGNLSSWVVNSSDRYVIALFLGTAYVGYYAPGYTLGNIIGMFVAPFSFILPAVLSKYYDENNLQEVQNILQYSLKYFLMLAVPSFVGLSILSKPLLAILSTPEIAANSYLITPFIALSALFFGVYAIIFQILILEKNTRITAMVWIIAAVINFGLNLVVIPYLGILGAAITTLISFIFALGFIAYYLMDKSKTPLLYNIVSRAIFPIILASISMIPVLVAFNPVGILSILITVALCAAIYFVLIYALKGVTKEEIYFFKNFV